MSMNPFLSILLLFAFAVPAFAQDLVTETEAKKETEAKETKAKETKAKETKDEPATVRELLDDSLTWYDIYASPDSEERLQPKHILRWTNPVRNNEIIDAFSAVYVANGRPFAMVAVFPSGSAGVTHELHTLSRQPGVIGRENEKIIWAPNKEETLVFRDIPDTKAPNKSKRLRSLQIKELSRRFEVEMLKGYKQTDGREMLRRLATPVYEYGKPETDTLDGAIFAFCVNGTDPDAFLQIEAYRSKKNGPFVWQYAFSRASGGEMVARFDQEAEVWKTERIRRLDDPKLAYFNMFRAIDLRRFANQ